MSTKDFETLGQIVKVAGKILTPAATLYFSLLVLSFVFDPPSGQHVLDTWPSKKSLLTDPPSYVVYRSTALASHQKTAIILGASNAQLGFRPADLSVQMPGIEIHNLALGGSNADGMAATVELAYAQRFGRSREDLLFILGIWYGQFLHNESSPNTTPIALQMERFGLFRRSGAGYERRLPPRIFDAAVTMLRPFFFLRRILGPQGLFAIDRTSIQPSSSANNLAGPACVPAVMSVLLAREKAAGDKPLPSAQFRALVTLAERIRNEGGRLILVDLPLPRCFTQVSGQWHRYQRQKGSFFAEAIAAGAIYVDMQNLDDDQEFYDTTHPKATTAPKWAARIARELARLGILSSR